PQRTPRLDDRAVDATSRSSPTCTGVLRLACLAPLVDRPLVTLSLRSGLEPLQSTNPDDPEGFRDPGRGGLQFERGRTAAGVRSGGRLIAHAAGRKLSGVPVGPLIASP